MGKATPVIAASGTALAAIVITGDRTASDALAAMVITSAVVIVLAVLGLLALLIVRVRADRLTYRPDPGIARTRTRAEVLARYPANGPESDAPGQPAIGRPDVPRFPLALTRGPESD